MSRNKRLSKFPENYTTGRAILDILIDLGENLTIFDSPYKRMRRLWRKEHGFPEPKRWRYNRAINYLLQAGHAEIIKKKDQIFIRLTRKGKLRALLERLEKGIQKNLPWDGRWRLVIWDIPETSRRDRNKIRRFVKDLGFYQLQQSVFITPYGLSHEAIQYLQESGLIEYLRLLRIDKLDEEKSLKKHFKLS